MKYIKKLEYFNNKDGSPTKLAIKYDMVKIVLDNVFWYTSISIDEIEDFELDNKIFTDLCVCVYFKEKPRLTTINDDYEIAKIESEVYKESEKNILKKIQKDPSLYNKYKKLIDKTYLTDKISNFIKNANKYNL